MTTDTRVSVRTGANTNLILIAPHGHDTDDTNTNILTLELAKLLDCNAVVNNGWKRHHTVDALQSLANCNHIDHCQEPVVYEEFFKPIENAIDSYYKNNYDDDCTCILIHGIGDGIRKKVPGLDLIVGFGNGYKPRITCPEWKRTAFVDLLNDAGYLTYEGAIGGNYSGWGKSNLTQGIREKIYPTDCLQLEIVYDRRKNFATISNTVIDLAAVFQSLMDATGYVRSDYVTVNEI
jgi:hypothetical protein